MRLFDEDRVGRYLDHIAHRVEKTADGEVKMVDLTLRVQPFTPALAVAFDPDVRALLFTLGDATPKPLIKAVHFALTIPNQTLEVYPLPDEDVGGLALTDVAIEAIRARTEKGVDGYALVFYASFEPATPHELEYVCEWLTQSRFVTFTPRQSALPFEPQQQAAGARA